MTNHSLYKKRLLVISSVFAIAVSATTMYALDYEYWFDGQSQSKVFGTIPDGGSFSLDISARELSPGLHTLFARVGKGNGEWSVPSTSHFIRSFDRVAAGATKFEYWFDGQSESKVSGTVPDGGSLNLDISARELNPGLHTLFARVSKGNGDWSVPSTSLFIRSCDRDAQEASEFEYWFDDDTKNRKRTSFSGTTTVLEIDASALSPGVHSLVYCAISKNGKRGKVNSAYFVKSMISGEGSSTLSAYRWWLNDGPEMTTVKIDKSPIPYQGVIPIEARAEKLTRDNAVVLASDGDTPRFGVKTRFNMMFRDDNGNWGPLRCDTFTVSIPAAQTDLTEFIANHDASDGNKGWKWEGSIGKLIQNDSHWTGEKLPYFCMGNPSANGFTTTMTQTIEGLPAGTYVLSAYGRANTEVTMTMSVGDNSVEFPAVGATGGELWENALPGDPALGLEKGGGWSRRSLVFPSDGTPFEIKVTGTTTQRGQWFDISDFSLRLNVIGGLSVNFPADADMLLYRNMRLVLEGDGRRLSKVVSESVRNYTFDGLSASSDYTVQLINNYGQTVASVKNAKADKDAAITFSNLKELVNPNVAVVTPEGNHVDASVEWTDSLGNVLATGDSLLRVPVGSRMLCNILLGEDAGKHYIEPRSLSIIASTDTPQTIVELEPMARRNVSGDIYGNGQPLKGASVSVTEFVNGKYPNTITARSGADGRITLPMAADSCRLTVMADGYVDYASSMKVGDSLGRIDLKQTTGAVVSFDISYSEASAEGPKKSQSTISLSDMNIVAQKTNADTLEYYRQNGTIVLPKVAVGENVDLHIDSPNSLFARTASTVKIEEGLAGKCALNLMEPGRVEAQYLSSQNKSDDAILFDSFGRRVASDEYEAQTVVFNGLEAGAYTLVSINADLNRNTVASLETLAEMGLEEGEDYISLSVNVKDGYITEVSTGNIPRGVERVTRIDAKSSFSAKKTTVTAGNFLTLIANAYFDPRFVDDVSQLSLVVDIPDDVDYIENSVVVGNHVNEARLSEGRLIVPIDNSEIGSQIKFCVMPLVGGQVTLPASLEFNLGGETLTESLGTAAVEVENLKMTVPEVISTGKFTVSGIAPAKADVVVSDCGAIIGETKALSDGRWIADCVLENPFHLTRHELMAKVTDASGRKFTSDIHRVLCDLSENEVSKVVMINTAHNSQSLNTCEYVTEFDFKEPTNESPVYWYWPSYPTFTFKVTYEDNSPERIKKSEVIVNTTDGNSRKVNTVYDPASDSWVGRTDFKSARSLPSNVSVSSQNFTDLSKPIRLGLLASAYAGVLESGGHSNLPDNIARIIESTAENYIRFESERNGKTASATMKFFDTDIIPDPSSDGPDVVRLETLVEGAEPLTILFDEKKDKMLIYSPYSAFEKISGPLGEILEKYNGFKDDTKEIKEEADRVNDILKRKGVQVTELDNFLSYMDFLDEYMDKASDMNSDFLEYLELIRRYERVKGCNQLVDDAFIDACIRDLKRAFDIYFCVQGACSLGEWAADKIHFMPLKGAVKVTTKAGVLASNVGDYIAKMGASNRLITFEQNCGISDGKKRRSGCADAQHVIDPSGYVYEAVTSNRLPGVTATVYELHKEEDMYGDIHETPKKWDASAYSQRNPVVTDNNGVYAWDVPQGEWQVRFEKDGYEPASTGWLPVPPPQLEINVGMTHAVAPDAVEAKAFESGVIVTFDKYMEPSSFSKNSIKASVKGKNVEGDIVPDNLETDPYTGLSFASELKLAVDKALTVGDSIDIVVGEMPRSYAGMEMIGQRQFKTVVMPEINEIEVDSVVSMEAGTSILVPVKVKPAKAAEGKWLNVRSASPSIIVPTEDKFLIDKDGVALVEIRALLPGSGVLCFNIENYTLAANTRVDAEAIDENRVTMPISSVPSGSIIPPGTEITLSTSTPDAIIRYTLDGTCPCMETSRQVYSGPIALSEDVVVKAQAFKDGLEPSEIAVFHYIVDDSGIGYIEDVDVNVAVDGDIAHISAPQGSTFEIYDTAGLTVVSGKFKTDIENVRLLKGEIYFVHVVTPEGIGRTIKIVI